MSKRRTMNEALKMTPEQVEFINEPNAGTQVEVADSLSLVENSSDAAQPVTSNKEPAKPKRQSKVQYTTKLTVETLAALKRVYLERKLDGDEDCTIQGIVEEALVCWFTKNGHLTPKS